MKDLGLLVLVTLLLVIGLGLLARAPTASGLLVPAPEAVAKGFISGLQAGRYAQARESLSEELIALLQVEDLRSLDASLSAQWGSYDLSPRLQVQERGNQATVEGLLATDRAGSVPLALGLERDPATGEWELSDLGGLQAAVR